MAAAPVPGSTADQQQRTTTGVNHGHIAEEGGTSVVEGSKSRRGKKRKGRRPGADRERKDHKEHRRDIGAPMEGHDSKRPHPTPVARSVVISAAVLSLCCAGVAIIVWFQVDYVEVRVKTGSAVRGYRAFIRNRWVYTFLGIEYAQPPVHNLRFRQPLPVVENSSVITATSKGPPCPQRDWFAAKVGTDGGWQGAEDCLHLNLWTPCIPNAEKADKCGKPVLIFLFAEGFQTGSNTRFDGSLLAATGDVVVVAPNFRLGVLLGTVFNEGSPLFEILAQEGDESDSYMRIALRELLTTYGVDNPAKLVDLYAQGSWGSPRGSNMSWAHQLLGDVLFECPVLSFADYLSSRKNRVYVYRFDHKVASLKLYSIPRDQEKKLKGRSCHVI
ncbi:hypothetical protein V5799_012363 [Amblyomma americanum]|uniref:Carboxylesterase type B domain-containing protein n=1 Tax=Amblyomma americanum TaxID=6943 RepID=A0AAQ4EEP2_AMBAM